MISAHPIASSTLCLGRGIRGDVRSPYGELIEAINKSEAAVLSVDVPSGLNSMTARPQSLHSRRSPVTFVCQKTGFQNPAAKDYTGTIEVRPIGLPVDWVVGRLGHDAGVPYDSSPTSGGGGRASVASSGGGQRSVGRSIDER